MKNLICSFCQKPIEYPYARVGGKHYCLRKCYREAMKAEEIDRKKEFDGTERRQEAARKIC